MVPFRDRDGRLPQTSRRWWLARTAAARLFEASGGLRLWDQVVNTAVPRIVYYHNVHGPDDDVSWCRESSLTMPVQLFQEHLDSLRRQFTIVGLDDVVAAPSPRRLAITFDDGYRGVYDNAFPLMQRWGIPSTVFLVTGRIGSAEVLWWDRLLTGVERVRLLSAWDQRRTLKDMNPKWAQLIAESSRDRLLDAYKLGTEAERDAVDKVLADFIPTPLLASQRIFLSAEEIQRLVPAGVRFGAHTISHPLLPWLKDEQLRAELSESRAAVLALTGQNTCWLSYPDGTFGEREEREAVGSGFAGAVQTGRRPECGGLYALPRVGISPAAITTFDGGFSAWRSRWILSRFSHRRLMELVSFRRP